MPADGVVIAKEAFRLVEQSQAYQGEEVASYLFHAYGTNLQFAPGEFNFVKTRAQHGTKEAFRLRDEHFHVPEPDTPKPVKRKALCGSAVPAVSWPRPTCPGDRRPYLRCRDGLPTWMASHPVRSAARRGRGCSRGRTRS